MDGRGCAADAASGRGSGGAEQHPAGAVGGNVWGERAGQGGAVVKTVDGESASSLYTLTLPRSWNNHASVSIWPGILRPGSEVFTWHFYLDHCGRLEA